MRKDASIKDWDRMHKELVDPEEREKARRREMRRRRLEDKKKDTGYDE